jgi:hypothetical protein
MQLQPSSGDNADYISVYRATSYLFSLHFRRGCRCNRWEGMKAPADNKPAATDLYSSSGKLWQDGD